MIDSLLRSRWVNSVTLSNRDAALQNLIIHEVLVKRKEALDQFCKGLKVLGIHSAIKTCPELMKVYFIAQQTKLSATKILELFANIDAVQECDRCEKARGFFINCIYSMETGIYYLWGRGLLKFLLKHPFSFSLSVFLSLNPLWLPNKQQVWPPLWSPIDGLEGLVHNFHTMF